MYSISSSSSASEVAWLPGMEGVGVLGVGAAVGPTEVVGGRSNSQQCWPCSSSSSSSSSSTDMPS
jgi:hypothetical protein